jgi:hypothetical protein
MGQAIPVLFIGRKIGLEKDKNSLWFSYLGHG